MGGIHENGLPRITSQGAPIHQPPAKRTSDEERTLSQLQVDGIFDISPHDLARAKSVLGELYVEYQAEPQYPELKVEDFEDFLALVAEMSFRTDLARQLRQGRLKQG